MEDLRKSGVTSLSQAFLSHKKDKLKNELGLNGFEMVSQSDPEGQFNDEEEGGNKRSQKIVARSCWSSMIMLAATGSVGIHISIIVIYGGVFTIIAGSIASAVAVTVAVAQLQLQYADSEYHHVQT
jgi:hypothetical protein